MNKGFVIMAQGEDYVTCAKALELSVKRVMPDANVTIITTEMLPHGDQAPNTEWKLQNDWQVYEASPYEFTIKLEADMYIPTSIEHFWDVCKHHDVAVSTCIRNFKQEISQSRAYRKFIDDNKLPDCYNGLTYFRKSPFAKQFFETVRHIFENWAEIRTTLQCNVDELATTDWVYALACHMLGIEKTTIPQIAGNSFSLVHMKQFINGLPSEKWTDTLVPEILPHTFRINTVPQMYPVHYHIKSFANDILETFK